MQSALGFADAHIHMVDTILKGGYSDMDRAVMLFSCSAHRSDWEILSEVRDSRCVRFYGIHPWYADEWSDDSSDALRSMLDADPSAGVGEIGLDSRHASCPMPIQKVAFQEQLDIASAHRRAANIHNIGCDADILNALRSCRGTVAILHAFSSESYVKPFSDLGCYFSINRRILARSDARLMRLMGSIPRDRILLESDAPFTPGFTGMQDFATELARRIGVSADDLISDSTDNAARIIHV